MIRPRAAARRAMPHFITLALLFPAALAAPGATEAEASTAALHEVPASVTVQLYVRPADEHLTVLARVPLEAMRDVEFPLTGPGYLVLEGVEPLLREAAQLWIVDYLAFFQGGEPLPEARINRVRISLPSDRSFATFQGAMEHLRAPGPDPSLRLPWNQALLDVELEVPVTDPGARFAVDPALAHLGVSTLSVIHFLAPGGEERVFQYRGNPGRVELDPRWHQAALTFVRWGFLHILEGLDHLLFLLCLVIPFRRVRPLVPVVTAFTVAHSITLAAAALGMAPTAPWFPPLVEALIALSIVWMALENMLGARLDRRWTLAFAFGLVHGFGFSFVLADSLQFAGRHLAASLLAFNVGVELGQLLVLAVTVPALALLFRRVPARAGVVVLSALVAHEAWHWMTARGSTLLQYEVVLPAVDALFLAAALRWTAVGVLAAGAAWGLAELFHRIGWEIPPDPSQSFRGAAPPPSTAKQ